MSSDGLPEDPAAVAVSPEPILCFKAASTLQSSSGFFHACGRRNPATQILVLICLSDRQIRVSFEAGTRFRLVLVKLSNRSSLLLSHSSGFYVRDEIVFPADRNARETPEQRQLSDVG